MSDAAPIDANTIGLGQVKVVALSSVNVVVCAAPL